MMNNNLTNAAANIENILTLFDYFKGKVGSFLVKYCFAELNNQYVNH